MTIEEKEKLIHNQDNSICELYVVTFWDDGIEPVVTAFNNHDAARKCYQHFSCLHDGCCLNHCDVYSNFIV